MNTKRFLELSRELERHSRGQDFAYAMGSFPSRKFHEWCELGKALDSEEVAMAGKVDPRDYGELPRYQSHKKVWALKIKSMVPQTDGSLVILSEFPDAFEFTVPAKFVPKHDASRPQVGWYWVRYEDGYESFSPPEPFEEGYTRI